MEKVLLFASGKGGVGKTTVCANVAYALARLGRRVLLIDADVYLRNADLVLGLSDEALFDIQDVYDRCANADPETWTAEKETVAHPLCERLYFLAAPVRLHVPPDALYSFLIRFARQQTRFFDYVLVDCPAGLYALTESLIGRRTSVMIVTTPELPAIRDADRVRQICTEKGAGGCRLVVNRVVPALIRKKKAPNIDAVIDSVGSQLIALVPEFINAGEATYKGALLAQMRGSTAARVFRNFAERIDGKDVPLYKFW